MLKTVGNKVYFRGLIEYSNYCIKDCLIVESEKATTTFRVTPLILKMLLRLPNMPTKKGYGSIVLQAGVGALTHNSSLP